MIHWLYYHAGLASPSYAWYLFHSGFGSILERLLELSVIGYILLRKHNCHTRRCWRIGKFPDVEGKGWHYCRRHHNDDGVQK